LDLLDARRGSLQDIALRDHIDAPQDLINQRLSLALRRRVIQRLRFVLILPGMEKLTTELSATNNSFGQSTAVTA
jgi:hypothetical protein